MDSARRMFPIPKLRFTRFGKLKLLDTRCQLHTKPFTSVKERLKNAFCSRTMSLSLYQHNVSKVINSNAFWYIITLQVVKIYRERIKKIVN